MKNLTFFLAISALILFSSCRGGAPKTDKELKLDAIKAHKEAVHVKEDGWIRDPYIVLGPDNMYYLTGTTPLPDDPREMNNRYNTGLGDTTVVGHVLQVWKSENLVDWESLGAPYSVIEDTPGFVQEEVKSRPRALLWAPELHWDNDKWILVHCPKFYSCLAMTDGLEMKGPWTHPAPNPFHKKHDPSLFKDDDGTWYLIHGNTWIRKIAPDFKGFDGENIRIDPADRVIGHEGATVKKIGDKYVHFGTAWSTDQGRKGSYNLYYATADKVEGPYSERRFAGRFLGHGTPFQDKEGNWWCTAFFNANVPPLDSEGIETRDLSETAQTINKQGTTIVPLEVKILPDGDVYIRAKDKRYATPGPDEVQQFE